MSRKDLGLIINLNIFMTKPLLNLKYFKTVLKGHSYTTQRMLQSISLSPDPETSLLHLKYGLTVMKP